jgi:hypothetical protein
MSRFAQLREGAALITELINGTQNRRNLRKNFGVAASAAGIGTMHRSEQYRRFARECLEMARVFVSERARAALVQMAQVWLRLADEEEIDNKDAGDES